MTPWRPTFRRPSGRAVLIMIYNDADGVLLGDRHPDARESHCAKIWPVTFGELGVAQSIDFARRRREGFFVGGSPWRIHRYGIPEDARFTISYSPIPDGSAPDGCPRLSCHCL